MFADYPPPFDTQQMNAHSILIADDGLHTGISMSWANIKAFVVDCFNAGDFQSSIGKISIGMEVDARSSIENISNQKWCAGKVVFSSHYAQAQRAHASASDHRNEQSRESGVRELLWLTVSKQ